MKFFLIEGPPLIVVWCRLYTADSRPKTADHSLQTTDCTQQTAERRLQTSDRRYAECKLNHTENYKAEI